MTTKMDTAMNENIMVAPRMLQQKILRLQRQVLEEYGFDTRTMHLENQIKHEEEDCFGCGFYIDSDENLNWDHIKIATVESFSHNISGVWGVDYVLTFRKSNNNPRAKRMALEAKVELEEAWEILNKLEQIAETINPY